MCMKPSSIGFPHLGQFIAFPPVLAKIKRLCLNKETKAQPSAVPLFLPGRRRSGRSSPPGNGGGPEEPTVSSALCSKGMPPVSSRPPCTKRRLSARIGGGDLSFSTRFCTMCSISYPVFLRMSREKWRHGDQKGKKDQFNKTSRKFNWYFSKNMVYWGHNNGRTFRRMR